MDYIKITMTKSGSRFHLETKDNEYFVRCNKEYARWIYGNIGWGKEPKPMTLEVASELFNSVIREDNFIFEALQRHKST